VSFNLKTKNADETAQALAEKGFCLRAGLHCSPLAHYTLGTAESNAGTVRYAPSVFSDMMSTDRLAGVIAKQ
ncbi:MAG: cysteine desulfurase, partial [Oscillospiraceae bacterium]|nr:cysteine desulfurase [Oscillospiraceae bacterium]